ncbi:MAG: trypsin-like peptidase domain-containing protein [Bacteroidales bacterium]|nr:trypsin-like peptidase domain-containing protein [Bacteroidales bacterium]
MWSTQYPLAPLSFFIHLTEPVDDIHQILLEENTRLKSWIYAAAIEVDITPAVSGQWDTIPGAGYVWRIGIRAENAVSLDLLLRNFHLQNGEAIHIYNESQTVIYTFTAQDNRSAQVLPVAAVDGNSIIVEWNVPVRESAQAFTISSVGYGFRNPHSAYSRMASSSDCQIDINCKTGNHWQLEKRAIVRLQTKQGSKNLSCTGVLVNQASDVKKPYILTAGHCVSDSVMAEQSVFTFEYENLTCESNVVSGVSKTISGARLLAYKKELDFALLELSADIPADYHPYYAGWSWSSQNPVSGVGIHHPSGDVKKICVDKDPLVSDTYADPGLKCDNNAHWSVTRWDEGVTEGGSSGSPIFDINHLIVGTLTGGDATCRNPVNDKYAKFSRQWNSYPTDSTSLKNWLDPDNTWVDMLHGYDPLTNYSEACDTMSHIGSNEGTTVVNSTGWGVMTGHNDKEWNAFAERFKNDTVATIIGLEANISQIYSLGSRVRFSVWTGRDYPVTEQWGENFVLAKEYRNFPFQVYFDRILELTEDYYIGYSISYDGIVDTFAVRQSVRRPYEGISSLYVRDGYTWISLSENTPPTYASLAVKAIGKFGREQKNPLTESYYKALQIVFQPASDLLFAYIENPEGTVKIECFDTSGKLMQVSEAGRHYVMPDNRVYLQVEVNTGHLPAGVYLLRVSDQKQVYTGKFIRLR